MPKQAPKSSVSINISGDIPIEDISSDNYQAKKTNGMGRVWLAGRKCCH